MLDDVIACPVDRGPLRRDGDTYVCTVCGTVYEVRGGIPVLLPPNG